MKDRKGYKIAIFIIVMIMINFVGKIISSLLTLPVWMDSLGTVLTAYICDPFCGAVVGLASNIMYGVRDSLSVLYGLTSIAIGISVGIMAKKKFFDTVFGTLTASVIVTIFSVIISTPINLLTNKGYLGNMWGDGVVSYLKERNIPLVIASATGEFYVDFLDKVITMMLLYMIIKIVRSRKKSMKKATAKFTASIIILSSVLLYNGSETYAKDSEINYNNVQVVYSSDNGLPCGEANDVIQTNDGIIWVGTYAGLYRYNGSEFKWMNRYNSVRNVNCMYVDEEGRLWIGTNDNGFSIVINENVTNVVDVEAGLPANSVRCITCSSDGYYYIGTTSSLQIMSLEGGLDFVKEIPEIVYAHSVAADDNSNVALVTNEGNLFLMRGEEIVTTMKSDVEQEIFTSVAFDDEGLMYVGTSSNNIYYYDISTGKPVKKGKVSCGSLININKMIFTEEDTMYICTDSGVGYLNEKKKFSLINTGGFNNSIDNMTIDYQGNLWFASSRLGLLKITSSGFSDLYRLAGISEKVVNSVTIWQNKLYVGTDIGVDILDIVTYKKEEDKLTKLLDEVRIRCLMVDSSDRLWISTYGKGLICVTKNGEISTYDSTEESGFGDWARVSIELEDKEVVAACDTGIGFFKGNRLEKVLKNEDGLSKAMILCMTQMSDDRLLCGSDGDGIAVIEDGKVIKRFTTENGLSSNVVLRIVEDPVKKGAYIVTSNGLCYMDKDDNIRFLEIFPYYNNYDVVACDNGEVFVLGSAGIYVTTRDSIFKPDGNSEFDLLDAKRGLKTALTANSWNYLDEKGNLYLSSDSGVYRMNIHNYGESRKSYRMMISSINLDNKMYELERGEDFYVSRNVSRVEIFPEVLNYTSADPDVQYYLEGFDTEPTVVAQSDLSSVVYTNLPAGSYRFHLSVLDSKTKRIIEESVFELEKQEEIYDTRWFHIYMLLVAMLAVAWLTWFIARTQIQRTLVFQKKELEYARKQVKMGNETILAIAKTVDAKDENTSQHSQRVSEYSVLIARELGFTEEQCENIRQVALLHDIGKIGIRDAVLNKPGRLTDEEYEEMKSHVTRGAKILKDFTVVDHAIEGVLYHHERYDGKGYPQGLAGDEIPLYGRIIGVADAFDAMTANRVYRKKLNFEHVINELRNCSGTQFDPNIVRIMLKLIDEKKIDINALYRKGGDK